MIYQSQRDSWHHGIPQLKAPIPGHTGRHQQVRVRHITHLWRRGPAKGERRSVFDMAGPWKDPQKYPGDIQEISRMYPGCIQKNESFIDALPNILILCMFHHSYAWKKIEGSATANGWLTSAPQVSISMGQTSGPRTYVGLALVVPSM